MGCCSSRHDFSHIPTVRELIKALEEDNRLLKDKINLMEQDNSDDLQTVSFYTLALNFAYKNLDELRSKVVIKEKFQMLKILFNNFYTTIDSGNFEDLNNANEKLENFILTLLNK